MVYVRPILNHAPLHERGRGSHAGGADARLRLLLTFGGWQQESWVDRLPRLLEPMGVRAVRAASGREATEALRRTRLDAAVVDLGLPLESHRPEETHGAGGAAPLGRSHGSCSGGGEARPASGGACGGAEAGARLLELLARLDSPPPIIVVRQPRARRDDARVLNAALRHGAFAVVDRPVDLELMLELMRRILARFYENRWPDGRPGQG